MSMEITFLGTGSAYPSPTRGASAVAFRYEGECWLFDCGEGTQTQFMKSHLKAGRVSKIFITHLHGDHVFGLPGLLCTISLQSSPTVSRQPVEIYGPEGLRDFVWRALAFSHSELVFPYVVHELVPTADQCPEGESKDLSCLNPSNDSPSKEVQGRTIRLDPEDGSYPLVENERFVVKAFRLFHRIPSFGFSLEEKERPGRLNAQKLKDLGVQPGPAYGKLKNGIAINLENGLTVSPQDVTEEPIPGRKICILGDCSGLVGDGGVRLCREADLLVHEATLDDSQLDKAREHGHSTPVVAAEFAKLCGAKKLVLTHFSQRYKPTALAGEGETDDVEELKRQAESVLDFQEVTLAEDFMVIDVPVRKRSQAYLNAQ
ncbi:zinc phosphodiesterase ELAC protein 1 isoform X1 [Tachyglossus aculeatus]|uniref:zinc phosphodiesterase ELAC protein 1 isoform X1 n=1 Tax=Tachyglossus aculeatus TaxID=9261 RepID=UPI0018F3CFD0|nr:zinc phosphodiesterase ELAC protein 1 isoform X1 [Tachyglossus aculeatus]XP_038600222.1 zinc phosphodiesterase ELAC protein 1 isoform X1 [Tachyglossus aculeatus]